MNQGSLDSRIHVALPKYSRKMPDDPEKSEVLTSGTSCRSLAITVSNSPSEAGSRAARLTFRAFHTK